MAIKAGRKPIYIDLSIFTLHHFQAKNLHKSANKEYFGDELRMDRGGDGVSLQAHLSYDLSQPRVA